MTKKQNRKRYPTVSSAHQDIGSLSSHSSEYI